MGMGEEDASEGDVTEHFHGERPCKWVEGKGLGARRAPRSAWDIKA